MSIRLARTPKPMRRIRHLLATLLASSALAAGKIVSFAGGDPNHTIWPAEVQVDASGNVYVSDDHYHQILKYTSDGRGVVIAGTGTPGYSGDGGPATAAALSWPAGIAFDQAGNVYVADSGNNVVRRIDQQGIIHTYAGSGAVPAGRRCPTARSADLRIPLGLVFDQSGNLYVSDSGNNVVRKIDAQGCISTVAGNGIAGYQGDGGDATAAELNEPWGLAIDAFGDLFIADSANYVVRRVDQQGMIFTAVGNGRFDDVGDGALAVQAPLRAPAAIRFDGTGNLYIVEFGLPTIRRVDTSKRISLAAGSEIFGDPNVIGPANYAEEGDGGPAAGAWLSMPLSVAVDASGNLYIADYTDGHIRKVLNGTSTMYSTFQPTLYPTPLTAVVEPALSALGKTGSVFVAVQAGNAWYSMTPNGWVPFDRNAPAAAYSGTLANMQINLLPGGWSWAPDVTYYAGYGQGATPAAAFADLLANGLYQRITPFWN